jgi:hypothetical protein
VGGAKCQRNFLVNSVAALRDKVARIVCADVHHHVYFTVYVTTCSPPAGTSIGKWIVR